MPWIRIDNHLINTANVATINLKDDSAEVFYLGENGGPTIYTGRIADGIRLWANTAIPIETTKGGN